MAEREAGKQGAFWRRWLLPLAQVAITAAIVAFFARVLARNWADIQAQAPAFNWWSMGGALLVLVGAKALLAAEAHLSLRGLGVSMNYRDTLWMYSLSQVYKYLPGGFWNLPGRVYLYHRAGATTAQASAALAWELLALILSVTLLALAGGGALFAQVGLRPLLLALAVGTLAGIMLAAIAFRGRLPDLATRPLRRWLPARLRALLGAMAVNPRPAILVAMLAVAGLAWLLIGSGFYWLAVAIYPAAASLPFQQVLAVFPGAWVIGFVTFFTPGGIGVREGIVVLVLGLLLPDPFPVLIAVTARLWWTGGDLAGVLVGRLVRWQRPGPVSGWVGGTQA